MTKAFKPKIASANDLFEGDVVYLDDNDNWTRQIAEAAVALSADAAEALLTRADQPARIVGPYLVDVTTGDDGVRPDHFREQFRDTGPTLEADWARFPRRSPAAQNVTQQGDL